ncbi:armadillo/beta-catenin/plakoglobin [Dacryopinax primogenitus]|uniref:Uridine kinase n=1 Tax=Dacryopinax primogenitus (strain DJM 731) TaxID=1858805 RepID=M5GDL7_DACPD|nr:armadillo/beta-catenin/plakoglobin [Dacryopinax primogenitus]EJU04632.1 armadillo/beta-catenin/plakoglobin [Dacryopinax primogenitus]
MLPTTQGAPTHKNHILTSHGRPPWYGPDGLPIHNAFVIGIAGGSASGKTYVAEKIIQSLQSLPSILILSQDSFYKKHNEQELALAFSNEYDFDHPSSIDMELFAQCLKDLKEYKQTHIPIYSFVHHQRLPETKYLYGASVIIVEGIMTLLDPALRDLYDLKIFVQCDSDLMLARRLRRDIQQRGRSVDDVLKQYLRFVKPAFDNFVGPSAKYADVIIPGAANTVAIDLVVNHIRRKLAERHASFRSELSRAQPAIEQGWDAEVSKWPGVVLLRQTPQLKGIHTILRDETTSREDFIFFADRLATLVVECGMDLLPYVPHSVQTPTDAIAHGLKLTAHVCGVSIIRAGGPLQAGLQRVLRDVPLGALLIQSDPSTGEPLLLHTSLPCYILHREQAKDTWVFLLDSQIGTGAAALMAIRVLLDHGVQEEHIIFLTFLISQQGGPNVLRKAFPGVRIVTSAVDELLLMAWSDVDWETGERRRVWKIVPGMGHIGDRYYL